MDTSQLAVYRDLVIADKNGIRRIPIGPVSLDTQIIGLEPSRGQSPPLTAPIVPTTASTVDAYRRGDRALWIVNGIFLGGFLHAVLGFWGVLLGCAAVFGYQYARVIFRRRG